MPKAFVSFSGFVTIIRKNCFLLFLPISPVDTFVIAINRFFSSWIFPDCQFKYLNVIIIVNRKYFSIENYFDICMYINLLAKW